MSFIFGGNTNLTYEQAKRQREIAQQLASRPKRPQTFGQGLSAIGEALAARGMRKRSDEKISETKNEAQSVFQGILGGGQSSGQPRGTDFNPAAVRGAPAQQSAQGGLGDMFSQKEQEFGLPGGFLARMAHLESTGDPNAQNPHSSAGGLFQFIDSTAKQYGLDNKNDPVASTEAAARFAADNAAVLRQRLGREPTAGELYLAHQQGAGGAVALLTNPDAPAAQVVGRDAVRLNGGSENMTAGQFANQWVSKFGGQGQQQPQQQPRQVAGDGPTVQQLMSAMAQPGMSQERKSVLGTLLQQKLQQQDPMRQMQMERERLELEQMRNPQPEMTSDMREYEFARRQGYQGTFQDFQTEMRRAGAPHFSVTTGQGERDRYIYGSEAGLPSGWRLDRYTGEASRTPGGPAAAEAERAEDQEIGREAQTRRAGSTVIQDLQRARDLIPELSLLSQGEGVVGGISRSASSAIPGTVANRITQFTSSALSNVGLDTLQQMRENSPTGGALGQVPIQQQKRLEQVLGSLDINQPPDVLDANMRRVMNIYTDIIYGDAQERAAALDRGEITPEQNAEIEGYYFDLPFDERGRSVDEDEQGDAEQQDQSSQGGMTFEQFSQDPSAQAAADRYGVSLEEMWEIKRGLK